MAPFEFHNLHQVRGALLAGEYTCKDLVSHYIDKAKKEDHYNAFLEVFQDSALAKAEEIDEKIKSGKAGRLAGCVLGLKDNLCYKGHQVSASSKILEGFESLFTATAVQRLLDEDAIIIGRLNCDEFAMGSSNENSAFGPVKNPLGTTLVPGGSSGGSAAAVAAGLCMAALGSDTGGSIRQPAAFTGNVGFKPTYGRVSRYGLIAYASSFDQIGPITRTVDDAALLMEIMAGKDEMDATSSSTAVEPLTVHVPDRKYRFAFIRECTEHEALSPEMKDAFSALVEKLRNAGHTVEEVAFPYLDHLVPTYYVITTAEASSNLARYDGIHFGYRSQKAEDIPSTYTNSRTEGFGTEVKRRIMLGTFVLSAGYFDAYYAKGQKVRRLIREKTLEILENADFIIGPTTPHPAFPIGEKAKDNIAMYLEDIFTAQANLAGVPGISVPFAKTKNGLPLGVQLVGGLFQEAAVVQAARMIENQFSE